MIKVRDDIHIEEKIPRLPAGGGGWDKKKKMKPSSGAPGNRLITVKKNVKQAVCVKWTAETMPQPPQAQCCRSMASSRMAEIQISVKSRLPTQSGYPPSKKQIIQKSSIHPGNVVNGGFPALSGELDDDREELLFSAEFARKASYRACSNSFWKKMECYFTSITSQDESYLKHQLDFADKAIIEAPSLHQRLISAIIEADESKERILQGEGKNDFQCANDDSHFVDQISEHDLGSVEDKLQVQLERLDLCPDMHAEEEDAINKDIIELEGGLVQQAQKKKRYIRKIYDSIQQGKHAEKRKLEQAAMSKLIEMAYKKQRVSRLSHSSKTVLRRVTKESALPFAERTLAKCLEFEETGRSCFSEGAWQNIIFSSPASNSVANSVGKHGSRDKQQYIEMNRDLLPNDVCGDSSRAIPGGSAKRKRSEKDDLESELKSMAKASNLLASGAEPGSSSMEATHAASDSPHMQDQDWQGLDIPMDDLSDVHFLSWF